MQLVNLGAAARAADLFAAALDSLTAGFHVPPRNSKHLRHSGRTCRRQFSQRHSIWCARSNGCAMPQLTQQNSLDTSTRIGEPVTGSKLTFESLTFGGVIRSGANSGVLAPLAVVTESGAAGNHDGQKDSGASDTAQMDSIAGQTVSTAPNSIWCVRG